MLNLISKIHEVTSNEVVILGGWSRHFNGYEPDYNSSWVDIAIKQNQITNISSLGVKLDITGGHSWGNIIVDQFIVSVGDMNNRNVIDVFVVPELPEYYVKQEFNILTEKADIEHHTKVYNELQSETVFNKLETRKEIYGL